MKKTLLFLQFTGLSLSLAAQSQPRLTSEQLTALTGLDAKTAHYGAIAKKNRNWAELGYLKFKNSARLQDELN